MHNQLSASSDSRDCITSIFHEASLVLPHSCVCLHKQRMRNAAVSQQKASATKVSVRQRSVMN